MAKIYEAALKSRKEIEKTIPRDKWGWWADVCPGKTLRLRDATDSDIARCSLSKDRSKNPEDYLCELSEDGALISKKAIKRLLIEVDVSESKTSELPKSPTQPARSMDALPAEDNKNERLIVKQIEWRIAFPSSEEILYTAYFLNGERITVLDRLTGYPGEIRDIETGYCDKDGKFWLASGNCDIRRHVDLTISQAIEWIKTHANTCIDI